jgi:hypothetical protein
VGRLGILKKLVWMPLVVAPLLGCSFETLVDKGHYPAGLGVINDSLAMVAVVYWEDWDDKRLGKGGGITLTDWGLMLVDTRYEHIYWERKGEKIKYGIESFPLEDSTMIFWDHTNSNFWFWKIGYPDPKAVKVRWTSENMGYRLIRPWKDGKFLAIGIEEKNAAYAILDTASRTMGRWVPAGDDAWLNDCVDVRWDSAKEESICLIVGDDPHNLSVLKNLADTLHISIPQDVKISGCPSLQSKLIAIALGGCYGSFAINPQTIFFVDSDLQLLTRKPIYFPTRSILFIDSLGNNTSYK